MVSKVVTDYSWVYYIVDEITDINTRFKGLTESAHFVMFTRWLYITVILLQNKYLNLKQEQQKQIHYSIPYNTSLT